MFLHVPGGVYTDVAGAFSGDRTEWELFMMSTFCQEKQTSILYSGIVTRQKPDGGSGFGNTPPGSKEARRWTKGTLYFVPSI